MKNIRFLGLSVEPWLFLLSFAVCIAVLFLSNFSTPYLLGDESYLYLRLQNEVDYDELSYGGRETNFPVGFGIVIGGLSNVIDDVFAVKLLHFLFGIFSFLLFFIILRKLGLGIEERVYSLFLLSLSPAFIYLFSFSGSFSIAIFLSLLALLLILYDKLVYGYVTFISVVFFNLYASLFGLILLFFYVVYKKKNLGGFLIVFSITMLLIGFLYGIVDIYREPVYFSSLLSDLGADYGLAIFALVLAFFGFVVLWRNKNYLSYVLFGVLFLFAFYYLWSLFYLTFFLSVIAAIGLKDMLYKKWESSIVRYFSLLLLILGVLFSGVSYIERVDEIGPEEQTITSLGILKNLPIKQDNLIFSHVDSGNWISYYTERKNFIDTNYINAPEVEKRINEQDIILFSGKENVVRDLLHAENITYIFLDREIFKQLLDDDKGGILRVFDVDPETYTLIYDGETEQIWKIEDD